MTHSVAAAPGQVQRDRWSGGKRAADRVANCRSTALLAIARVR